MILVKVKYTKKNFIGWKIKNMLLVSFKRKMSKIIIINVPIIIESTLFLDVDKIVMHILENDQRINT